MNADEVKARLANVDTVIRDLLRALAQDGDKMVGLMNRRTRLRLKLADSRTERARRDTLEAWLGETEQNQDLLGQQMDRTVAQLADAIRLEDALRRQLEPPRPPARPRVPPPVATVRQMPLFVGGAR